MSGIFTVYSPLGKQPSYFYNQKDATAFFEKAPGDVVLLSDGKECGRKEEITTLRAFVQSALFWRRNILEPVEKSVLEIYEKALYVLQKTDKGICLAGDPGIFKTTIMDFISLGVSKGYIAIPEAQVPDPPTRMQVFDCIEIANQYRISGVSVYDEWKLTGNYGVPITLDDLGAEGGLIKRYGDTFNLIGTLITNRYRAWTTEGLRTHLTTNLLPEEMKKMYADQNINLDRAVDRLFEMTTIIPIDGQTKRKKTII